MSPVFLILAGLLLIWLVMSGKAASMVKVFTTKTGTA